LRKFTSDGVKCSLLIGGNGLREPDNRNKQSTNSLRFFRVIA